MVDCSVQLHPVDKRKKRNRMIKRSPMVPKLLAVRICKLLHTIFLSCHIAVHIISLSHYFCVCIMECNIPEGNVNQEPCRVPHIFSNIHYQMLRTVLLSFLPTEGCQQQLTGNLLQLYGRQNRKMLFQQYCHMLGGVDMKIQQVEYQIWLTVSDIMENNDGNVHTMIFH